MSVSAKVTGHCGRTVEAGQGWTPPTTLSARERSILGLLATGATDAAVAARLGISVRTIAYTLRDLMERHGVQTRFQLGLILGAETVHSRLSEQADGDGSS